MGLGSDQRKCQQVSKELDDFQWVKDDPKLDIAMSGRCAVIWQCSVIGWITVGY